MERVTGIGGIFFKSKDAKKLAEWYRDNLGVPYKAEHGGAMFNWSEDPKADGGMTIWSTFPETTKYFEPSTSSFMINFRVSDMDALIAQLSAAGVKIDEKRDDSPYGKFAWVYDPEGNKVELWQPPDADAK